MGIYRKYIFPRLLDLGMSRPVLDKYRRELLKGVSGEVLEIGFGTGVNIAFYPEGVGVITAIDGNGGMNKKAYKRISSSNMAVKHIVAEAQSLPFGKGSFDSVVSSFTLCSIREVEKALAEVFRVLKPSGRYFFLEHGLSPESGVEKWQRRLTPLSKALADGCHLNRNIKELIETQPFEIEKLDRFYADASPRVTGYLYQGIAVKVK